MSAGIISVFQNHCDSLIRTLTIDINNFKNLNDDYDRIKCLYEHAKSSQFPQSKTSKSYENAVKFKTNGNKLYEKKDLDRAIEAYNASVIDCPQNNGEFSIYRVFH